MKAVMKVATGVGHVELRDIAEPAPGPGQVLIRVKAAGICGTDLDIYHDEFNTVPPVVLGHEVAGEISGARPWCFRHRRRQTRDHGKPTSRPAADAVTAAQARPISACRASPSVRPSTAASPNT